ncbi:helix-turn-helix domain-containing protein [Shewanella sp. 0m-4]
MITWKHQIDSLKHLIDWVWYLDVSADDNIDAMPQLVPNVNAHYIISPNQQPYQYTSAKAQFSGRGSYLLTANTQTLILDDKPPLTRLGFRFTPTALYQLKQQQAGVINQCVKIDWLDDLLPPKRYQALIAQANKETLLQQVERDLSPLLTIAKSDPTVNLVEKSLLFIEQSNGMLSSEHLAKQCFCTKRTLERAFSKVVGLSIKQYQTIVKFEALFTHLYQHPLNPDWAALADQYGFSDQPHLIRQMKKILGVTPAGYISARDLVIDIYGDFE